MTPLELFEKLGPRIEPMLHECFGPKPLCILATRVCIDVARYFDITVEPWVVRAIATNAAFEAHVENGDWMNVDIKQWIGVDGSHSVGIGFPIRREEFAQMTCLQAIPVDTRKPHAGWAGHLIARSNGHFADFTISQGERRDKGIVLGQFLAGPLGDGLQWHASNDGGCVLRYWHFEDESFRRSRDWRDENRRRKIVGKLIREVRGW